MAESNGDELARLYAEHSRRILQLTVLLVPDPGVAREVMYEAFAALDSGRRRRSRPSDDAFLFLLRVAVHRARTAACEPDRSARSSNVARNGNSVLAALRSLPRSQREALILHTYGQLPDWQAAAAMGVRQAELRAYVDRGMAALRDTLANDHLRCLSLGCDGG